jgi:hypothetical protein
MPVLSNGIVVSQNFYNFLEDTHKNAISYLIIFRDAKSINKDINYLDCHYVDGEVRISYLDTKKFLGVFGRKIEEEEAFSDIYSKKRIYVNPGRIVKKLFTDECLEIYVDNEMIEKFVYLTFSYFGTQLEYKVVKGEDIRKYYFSENYFESIGSLGNSCMKYGVCQPYLDIYVDKAKMLIGLVPGTDKISLRALLWDDVNVDSKYELKKIKMMDRIYSTYERYVPQAKKWAQENGYFYKSRQSNDCMEEVVDLDGNVLYLEMSIDMKIKKYEHYPYMDTFFYGYRKYISNYNNVRKERILLRETNGSFE